jgi:hypothetical protein
MRNKKNKILSILILLTAFLISGYLIFSPEKSSGNENQKLLITKPQEENKTDNLKFKSNVELENFTNKIAAELLNKAKENNFYYDKTGRIKIVPTEKEIEKTIEKIIEEEFSKPIVTSSDIKIGKDDSKEVKAIYILYLYEVLQRIPTYTTTSENQSFKDYSFSVAQNFDMAFNLLKIVQAPPSFFDIHYKVLTLLAHERNLFLKLTTNENDPLGFLTSLYLIKNDPFEKEIKKIQEEISKKIKDEKLY